MPLTWNFVYFFSGRFYYYSLTIANCFGLITRQNNFKLNCIISFTQIKKSANIEGHRTLFASMATTHQNSDVILPERASKVKSIYFWFMFSVMIVEEIWWITARLTVRPNVILEHVFCCRKEMNVDREQIGSFIFQISAKHFESYPWKWWQNLLKKTLSYIKVYALCIRQKTNIPLIYFDFLFILIETQYK